MALIALIVCMLSGCQGKNVRIVDDLDAINTANSKSYKGGKIVDDRMVRKAKNLKIKGYTDSNIKIRIFWEN